MMRDCMSPEMNTKTLDTSTVIMPSFIVGRATSTDLPFTSSHEEIPAMNAPATRKAEVTVWKKAVTAVF